VPWPGSGNATGLDHVLDHWINEYDQILWFKQWRDVKRMILNFNIFHWFIEYHGVSWNVQGGEAYEGHFWFCRSSHLRLKIWHGKCGWKVIEMISTICIAIVRLHVGFHSLHFNSIKSLFMFVIPCYTSSKHIFTLWYVIIRYINHNFAGEISYEQSCDGGSNLMSCLLGCIPVRW